MPPATQGRVLVFGDDMRVFLAVVRSLGRAGKEVHAVPFNSHAPALKSKYVSRVHKLPRYSDDPEVWRRAVLETLRAHSIDLVVPCEDRAILPLHQHRDDFIGFRLAIPNPVAMELLFDKERTRELCAKLGIATAPGARLSAENTAETLISRFGLPLILKPRRSFWIDRLESAGKVFIVDNASELRSLLKGINEPGRYLAEGYFDGVGVGVSVLADGGSILHSFQHRRLREGRGGSSSYRVSEPVDAGLYRACEKICRHTGLSGVCMFEFRWNPGNRNWVLLETNARFWGSLPLPVSLGVNFPLYLYDLLVHHRHHALLSYPAGITSRNVMLDAFNLIAAARRLERSKAWPWLLELAKYAAQPLFLLSGRERSDSLVRDDLRPAFWELANLLTSLRPKLRRGERSMQQSEQTA